MPEHIRVRNSSCSSCRTPLCDECAARWQPPHCDRCALTQGHNQQAWILWPLAALAAWLMLMVLAYAVGWQGLFSVRHSWRPPFWPTLLVTYLIGAGAVGGVDLLIWLVRALPRDARRQVTRTARGFLILLLVPLSLAAGAVFVPVRAVLSMIAFIRGTAKVRRARASMEAGSCGSPFASNAAQ